MIMIHSMQYTSVTKMFVAYIKQAKTDICTDPVKCRMPLDNDLLK